MTVAIRRDLMYVILKLKLSVNSQCFLFYYDNYK